MESRQNNNGKEQSLTETSTASSVIAPQLSSTANIKLALNEVIENFIIVEDQKPHIPPAVVYYDELIHLKQISDDKKNELGVKSSCHTVDIVAYDQYGCDIVFSPSFPNDLHLDNLPGKSNACYVFAANKKLYYADKQRKLCTPISISHHDFDTILLLCLELRENYEGFKLMKLGKECEGSYFNSNQFSPELMKLINQYQILSTIKKYNYKLPKQNNADESKGISKHKLRAPQLCSGFVKLKECDNFQFVLGPADKALLQLITLKTKHIHGMCFFKKKEIGSPKSAIEAINSTAYQLLGPRHFPSCFVVKNSENKDIGIISIALPGFKPNRDRPLEAQDLEISSLKQMIKNRDEYDLDQLEEVFSILKKLIPLLTRDVNKSYSYLYQVWEYAKFTGHYYLGDTYSAVHVKPQLDEFIKKNKPYISFGDMESLYLLLINRKANIEKVEGSYVATQHKHADELVLIEKALEKIGLILLDESALFIKQLHRISRKLEKDWVDLNFEKNCTNSCYANIHIEEGLLAKLHVSIDDIIHYRIICGLAIGLMNRYFLKDHDGHAKNLAYDGCNLDADEAVDDITYRYKNPRRKPGADDFILSEERIIHFPNFKNSKIRYWPTVATIFDTSADAALSPLTDLTKNYFTTQDNQNYQSLEYLAIFNFRKYVQVIIDSIVDKNMFSACAVLHMNDQFNMLNEEGDVNAPLPLSNEKGEKQDLMTTWVENMTKRALDALSLACKLKPVKIILERHSELVLEIIQDSFEQFLHDKKMELLPEAAQAYYMLEQTMKPERISDAFYLVRQEILCAHRSSNMIEVKSNSLSF